MVGCWLPWQRIAFGFLLVALCEIWAPRGPFHNIPEGTLEICKVYYVHWLVSALHDFQLLFSIVCLPTAGKFLPLTTYFVEDQLK
jgi:hypothetical protein